MQLLWYEANLDVTTALNAFRPSTSNDSNNATHKNPNEKEDNIYMIAVNLDDL